MSTVSLIVPFYNEEDVLENTVPTILRYCKRRFTSHEIIFVDDGSTDGSRKIVKKHVKNSPNVRVVGYKRNSGRGAAIRKGFKPASGSYIGYIDCDLEMPMGYVKKALYKLETHDIAIASKIMPGSVVRAPYSRKISSALFNRFIRIMFRSSLQDHQAGLKFFRKKVLDRLLSQTQEKGWLWDVEILCLAQKEGYDIYELPVRVTYGYRKMRGSFIADFIKLIFMVFRHKARI